MNRVHPISLYALLALPGRKGVTRLTTTIRAAC